jgi:enoyl-CoA hydratase/carnithine racemase
VIAREARYSRDIWALIRALSIPVIVALHGYVIGSGIEMALCCDMRLATTEATFALPEVPLGMIPFAGGSQTLPRTIGKSRALDLLLTGRTISAEEAFEFGLIHQIIDKQDLKGKALEQASILASLDPSVIVSLKSAISRGANLPLKDAIKLERHLSTNAYR